MKGNFKKTTALTLLTNTALEDRSSGTLNRWQKLIAEQFDEISRQERMTPRRALAVGLMLHAVKASVKHGEFTPWLKQTLVGLKFAGTLGYAQVKASFYMRLAIAFVEETKPSATEMKALPAGGLVLNLEGAKGPAAQLVSKIDTFCGESSLGELLDLHVKNGGGGGPGNPAATTPAADTAIEWLLNLRKTYLDPRKMKVFPAKHLKQVEQQAASFLEEYRSLLREMNLK